MALTVEDGSGVTDADAYISLADAEALYLKRNGEAWAGTDADKEAAIIRATSWVDTLDFVGSPSGGRSQSLQWPRKNATDRNGYEIDTDELPHEVEDATGILAFAEFDAPGILTPDIDRTAFAKREKVGPIEVENVSNPGTESWNRVTVTAAMDLLNALTIGVNTKFLARA